MAEKVNGNTIMKQIRNLTRHLPVEPVEDPGEAPIREVFEVFEQQALVARRAPVQSGQLLSPAHLQEALTLIRQAVNAATRAGRLFTVKVEGQPYFPAFYVNGRVERSVLEDISELLGQLPGWTKWHFLTSRRGALGNLSPLDLLREGKAVEVRRVARAFAEEHAS